MILPRKNENDLDDVPEDVRGELNFILVERLDEVLDVALIDEFALAESERTGAILNGLIRQFARESTRR